MFGLRLGLGWLQLLRLRGFGFYVLRFGCLVLRVAVILTTLAAFSLAYGCGYLLVGYFGTSARLRRGLWV